MYFPRVFRGFLYFLRLLHEKYEKYIISVGHLLVSITNRKHCCGVAPAEAPVDHHEPGPATMPAGGGDRSGRAARAHARGYRAQRRGKLPARTGIAAGVALLVERSRGAFIAVRGAYRHAQWNCTSALRGGRTDTSGRRIGGRRQILRAMQPDAFVSDAVVVVRWIW